MGLSFFAPLFLAGGALLVAPYLIHQIRRPEREPLKFSSLLFIPDAPREVIERRRVQHILLMLMRMTVLALLAFAFARPFWKVIALGEEDTGAASHLILVDVSYSMGRPDVLSEAREQALDIVSKMGPADRVGVAVFAKTPELVAALEDDADPGAGTAERAREAIAAIAITEEDTAYLPALRFGQGLLTAGANETESADSANRPRPLHLHLVSDFQRAGMPNRNIGWKLAPAIALHTVRVGPAEWENVAVTDVDRKRLPDGGLRVVAKVKNWSTSGPDRVRAALTLNGVRAATNEVTVKAGNATQVSLVVGRDEVDLTKPIRGFVDAGEDGLRLDNRRYFSWNPPQRAAVVIVPEPELPEGSPGAPKWRTDWFLMQAAVSEDDLPWTVERTEASELRDRLAAAPPVAVVVVSDLNVLDDETLGVLSDYIGSGCNALFLANAAARPGAAVEAFMSRLGLALGGPRYTEPRETQYEMFSWIDLDHQIFSAFRGTRFNDFSTIRFYNTLAMTAVDESSRVRVLGRFEDGSAALAESTLGEGRVIVWPFPLWLEWSNLPKSTRFVPLLQETLEYLCDVADTEFDAVVGDRFPLISRNAGGAAPKRVRLPGERELAARDESAGPIYLGRSGILEIERRDDSVVDVHAINVNARESDPAPISEEEFQLKMASVPLLIREAAEPGLLDGNPNVDQVAAREYGRMFLIALFLVLVIESAYMSLLRR